jgi:hypothetical protein
MNVALSMRGMRRNRQACNRKKAIAARHLDFSLGVESSMTPRIRSQMRILSLPTGQELAPWRLHQVAVASTGLSPLPLWISAALQQRWKINKKTSKSQEKEGMRGNGFRWFD